MVIELRLNKLLSKKLSNVIQMAAILYLQYHIHLTYYLHGKLSLHGCAMTQLSFSTAHVLREGRGVSKLTIRHVKGFYGLNDLLQFVTIQDLVHFYTLHSFEIEVKLKTMNVTEHYKLRRQKYRSVNIPAVKSDSQVSEVHYIAWCYVYFVIHCNLM